MSPLCLSSFCFSCLIAHLHSHIIFALPDDPLDSSIIQLPASKQQQDPTGSSITEAKPAEKLVCDYRDEGLSCPVSCFRTDPVCGADGVTYWCGCKDAKCANVQVAHVGFCNFAHSAGSGGLGLLSGQALLLIHTVWLVLLGLSVLIGLA